MKKGKKFLLVTALFFAATMALLEVDRQCGYMYQTGGTISAGLQLFIENMLDLH